MSGRPWGWHRLDPDWAERIVANATIRPGELVVDLGAGVGALTLPLLEAGARVIAVELHAGRARRLREKVSGHAASVVECDLDNFVPPGRPFRVVANPPYALTAAVLAFIAHARHLTAADLVLQRAVVRRVIDRDRRNLRRFHARSGLLLPRKAFLPPTSRLSRPPTEAAEAVANIPRNQHRTWAAGEVANILRPAVDLHRRERSRSQTGGSGDLGQPENVRGLKLRELQTHL